MIATFNELLTAPLTALFIVLSSLGAILTFCAWKKYNYTSLLYVHLFFIVSPLFVSSIKINCSMGFLSSFLSLCTMVFANFMMYVLPPVLVATFVVGAIFIPKMYERTAKKYENKAFKNLCKKTSISAQLFVVDKALPVAFSINKKVFVSVGMFESLSKKELESVLLHELSHVKNNSAWNKFSINFVRLFSPVAWFSGIHSIEKEERIADAFAVKIQNTNKFLLSAKKKVSAFRNEKCEDL